jgi:hypothetical protein
MPPITGNFDKIRKNKFKNEHSSKMLMRELTYESENSSIFDENVQLLVRNQSKYKANKTGVVAEVRFLTKNSNRCSKTLNSI